MARWGSIGRALLAASIAVVGIACGGPTRVQGQIESRLVCDLVQEVLPNGFTNLSLLTPRNVAAIDQALGDAQAAAAAASSTCRCVTQWRHLIPRCMGTTKTERSHRRLLPRTCVLRTHRRRCSPELEFTCVSDESWVAPEPRSTSRDRPGGPAGCGDRLPCAERWRSPPLPTRRGNSADRHPVFVPRAAPRAAKIPEVLNVPRRHNCRSVLTRMLVIRA